MTTLVVGGGWAGLAAAITLTQHHHAVTLIEASRQLGGRARAVNINGRELDNGQHLVIGAYRHFLDYLRILDVGEQDIFERLPMRLVLRELSGTTRTLRAANLPAPWHLLVALMRAEGFTRAEKRAAIGFCIRLVWRKFHCNSALTVAQLLAQSAQPPALIYALWEPLCVATLNTPIAVASAQVFLRVLRDSFMYRASDSDALIPRRTIGDWFANPATRYLNRHHVPLLMNTRVTDLIIDNNVIQGVITNDGKQYSAHNVIVAIPPNASATLMRNHPALQTIAQQLAHIPYEPIVTVYLRYNADISTDFPMLGVLGAATQWVFDRRYTGDQGIISVVISAASQFRDESNALLGNQVANELAQLFPAWPRPQAINIIREKRATFLCTPQVQTLRSKTNIPINGLFLAGDYVTCDYPATLEGAVISGRAAAQQILALRSNR
ncbi:MAG: hydroxysqualene dehydroxylase HpnE [Pseudomonadota bacterium]